MEELLSKEEILARSQQENKNGDEMEKTVRIQGESFSLLFVFLIGIVLLVWKRVHHLPDEDVLAMFWVSCVANRLYRLTRRYLEAAPDFGHCKPLCALGRRSLLVYMLHQPVLYGVTMLLRALGLPS